MASCNLLLNQRTPTVTVGASSNQSTFSTLVNPTLRYISCHHSFQQHRPNLQGSDQLHCIATWTTYKWSISISSTSLALGLHNNTLHSDLKMDVMEWNYVE